MIYDPADPAEAAGSSGARAFIISFVRSSRLKESAIMFGAINTAVIAKRLLTRLVPNPTRDIRFTIRNTFR